MFTQKPDPSLLRAPQKHAITNAVHVACHRCRFNGPGRTAQTPRRGAGAVDRGGLENRCTRKGTEGSNPSLSANFAHKLLKSADILHNRFCHPQTYPQIRSGLVQTRVDGMGGL